LVTNSFHGDFEGTDLETFWKWARGQGDGYQLAAYLIVGFCGGSEGEGFQGFNRIRDNAHPARIAWALDHRLREMLAEFLEDPSACMVG
jgi:hypothetical protein